MPAASASALWSSPSSSRSSGASSRPDHSSHAGRPGEPLLERLGGHALPAEQRVAESDQIRGPQVGSQVQEGLRARRDAQPFVGDHVIGVEPAGVDDEGRVLGEDPPRGQDDMGASREVEGSAEQCRRRHRVVYGLLRALGVSDEVARIDAEGIEHHVSEETLRAFELLLARQAREEGAGA